MKVAEEDDSFRNSFKATLCSFSRIRSLSGSPEVLQTTRVFPRLDMAEAAPFKNELGFEPGSERQ